MSEDSGGIIRDTPFGDITVFREYKPTSDRIEYTIYLRVPDGTKARIDIDGSVAIWDRIENDPEGPGIETFMHDTIKRLLVSGDFRGEGGKSVDEYKGYSID